MHIMNKVCTLVFLRQNDSVSIIFFLVLRILKIIKDNNNGCLQNVMGQRNIKSHNNEFVVFYSSESGLKVLTRNVKFKKNRHTLFVLFSNIKYIFSHIPFFLLTLLLNVILNKVEHTFTCLVPLPFLNFSYKICHFLKNIFPIDKAS